MRVTMNGKPCELLDWPSTVVSRFATLCCDLLEEDKIAGRLPRRIRSVNYFTARPFVDEYNRGSGKAGFTFVIGRDVFFKEWKPATDEPQGIKLTVSGSSEMESSHSKRQSPTGS